MIPAAWVASFVRNNRLSAADSGNVIITLLDQNGNVLAQQQSYNASAAGNGLIALGKEEMASKTFSFVGVKAASARVVYSDAKLNSNSNALSSLSLDGVTLDYDEATKTYTGSGTDLVIGMEGAALYASSPNALEVLLGEALAKTWANRYNKNTDIVL